MKIFENKDINEEIAALKNIEIAADEEINPDDTELTENSLCGDITVKKTILLDEGVCDNRIVHVTLEVWAKKKLTNINITDFLSHFMERIEKENPAPTGTPSIGSIVVDNDDLTLAWSGVDIDGGKTATLKYDAIIKQDAIGVDGAYVNKMIKVEDPDKNNTRTCTKYHGDSGIDDELITNCPVTPPTVTSLIKDNDKNEYGCNEIVTSTLTITIDKADTNIIITDDIATELVGAPTNITVSPGVSADAVFDGDKIIWIVNQEYANATTFILSYEFNSSAIAPSGYVSDSVTIKGDNLIEKTFPRDNAEFPFHDDYVVDCPEENGECCCQACQPITVEPCDTFIDETINVESIRCTGKLVNVTVNLQSVCPGRTLNVGVLLVENVPVDGGDETTQESRGFIVKQVSIPEGSVCASREVNGFCFPLADDAGCDADDRTFTAKVFATYIGGTVPECDCDTEEPTPEA